METSEKETISLVVKTPSQLHGDQLIEKVNTNWTVRELKAHLESVHPSKPAEKDQKLIYSGKLLLDNQHIRDVFGKTDMIPTLHLVCAFRTQPGHQQGARPKVRPAEQPSSPVPLHQSTQVPSVPAVPSVAGLRQRGHPAPTVPTAASPATGTSNTTAAGMTHPAFPNYSLYSPQQLLWLQHMYARQYYMQYHAAMAAAAPATMTPAAPPSLPVPAPHQAAIPAALPNQGPINNLPVNQNAPEPALINPEGPNQNLRMNAQGGPVMEDEEGVQWDWLDWIYTASRFAVLLNIVYFYSNPSRFILVMLILVVMHMHTAGWFPFRPRARAQPQNQPVPEVIQNQQNQDQDQDQDQERQPEHVAPPAEAEVNQAEAEAEGEAEGEGEAAVQPSMTAVPVSPVRPPILWTVWLLFKGFFASLIPEVPQGIAN